MKHFYFFIIFFLLSFHVPVLSQTGDVNNQCAQHQVNLYKHVAIVIKKEEDLQIAKEAHEEAFEEYRQCIEVDIPADR